MATIIAFLRAINVGGRFIKMATLRSHFEDLGVNDVSTYINSGNVLFSTRARDLRKLEATIERGLEPLLGFKSEVFLRTADEVHAVASQAASHRRTVPEFGEVNVAFVTKPLEPSQVSLLYEFRNDVDDFSYDGREIYWLCKARQMTSKFSNAALERKLRLRCTFRRVSMLEKLSLQLQAGR